MKDASSSVLSHVGVFSLLSPQEIELLAEHMATVEHSAGETVFREGDQGDNLYILADGTAAVTIKLPDGGSHEIARFARGISSERCRSSTMHRVPQALSPWRRARCTACPRTPSPK